MNAPLTTPRKKKVRNEWADWVPDEIRRDWMDQSDIATELGISRENIIAATKAGDLPYIFVSPRCFRYCARDVWQVLRETRGQNYDEEQLIGHYERATHENTHLNSEQLCQVLRISVQTLNDLIDSGTVPVIHLLRKKGKTYHLGDVRQALVCRTGVHYPEQMRTLY